MTTTALNPACPDFSAQATDGQLIKLSELKGKQVVLYFYPKDSTPGCTMESENFRDLYPEFTKNNTVIFGMSRDSLSSHEKFRCKYNLPFALISDSNEALCKLFDVIKEKNMYGKKVMGIERSTFLINKEGKLVAEWRGVKVPGHAAAVLEAIKKL
ncbi:MAG: peroxiredoxin [Gammaproteobacteria bacterium]